MAESLLAALQAKKNVISKPPLPIAPTHLSPPSSSLRVDGIHHNVAPEREFKPLPAPEITMQKPLNQTTYINQPQIINRPASIAQALEIFGPNQVDNLLGTLFEFQATEGDINSSANHAGMIRRLLVIIILLCNGAAVILNSAPLCGKNDPICLANTAMISAIINAIGVLFIFILEKISIRNDSVRLRDLGNEFSSLSNELHNALYINPPPPHQAQNFIMNINARAAELKTRAVSYKVRPKPVRGSRMPRQQGSIV